MGISLNPKTYISGGLFEEGIYRFTNVAFQPWDYDGKAERSAVGLMAILLDPETGRSEQKFWSVGGVDQWRVTQDGHSIEAVGNARGIRENSNFAQLATSLVNAGYPEDHFDTDDCAALLSGMLAHLINQKAPSRERMEPQAPRINPATGQPYPQREPEVVVVAEIKEYPWEAKDPGAASGATALGPKARVQPSGPLTTGAARRQQAQTQLRPVAQEPGPPDGTISEEALEAALGIVSGLVDQAGGPGNFIERRTLTAAAGSKLRGDPLLPQVMAAIVNRDVFAQWENDGVVAIDGTRVTVLQ